MTSRSINILFICSKNKWRSPTAEKIYAKKNLVHARSAGTSSDAKRKVSYADIKWANIVFVMEKKHKQRLLSTFPDAMRFKEIHILDIEDNYKFMDPELVELIKDSVTSIIDL